MHKKSLEAQDTLKDTHSQPHSSDEEKSSPSMESLNVISPNFVANTEAFRLFFSLNIKLIINIHRFRNNSIACLRAKAQEHQAKLESSGFFVQPSTMKEMAGKCETEKKFPIKIEIESGNRIYEG